MKLRYTLPALADLSSILGYIAAHPPQGARLCLIAHGGPNKGRGVFLVFPFSLFLTRQLRGRRPGRGEIRGQEVIRGDRS